MAEKKSTHQHWEQFWKKKKDTDAVYPDSGAFFRHLLSHAGGHGDGTVLEVGAGSGRDGLRLAREGFSVVVLDYSMEALMVAEDAAGNETKPVQGDAYALPFGDETVDIVFHQGLLEHFRDPEVILMEQRRVLKPGGLLVVTVPQKFHPYTAVKHVLIALDRWFAGWETEYTIAGLEKLVNSSGFRTIDCYGEWMYPGFFYRSFRELMKGLSVNLPMYPKGPRPLREMRGWFREKLGGMRLSFYTFITVGVVAKKVV